MAIDALQDCRREKELKVLHMGNRSSARYPVPSPVAMSRTAMPRRPPFARSSVAKAAGNSLKPFAVAWRNSGKARVLIAMKLRRLNIYPAKHESASGPVLILVPGSRIMGISIADSMRL